MEQIPITPEGHARLTKELERLKTVARPKVIQAIAEARGHGDLKENAEYHAAREEQGIIEAKIKELESGLAISKVADFRGQDIEDIRIGAYVVMQDVESEAERKLRLVAAVESDIDNNMISISSPIGRALVGSKVGDIVEVKAPGGVKEYEITEVKY